MHIFTDSQDSIHAIRSKDLFLGPEGMTLRQLHEDLEMIEVKDISYVPRSQNLVADGLAKLARSSSVPHAWIEVCFPCWIEELVRQELV